MTQIGILEAMEHFWKCIHSASHTKYSGTEKRQRIFKSFQVLHPRSGGLAVIRNHF